MNLLRRHFTSKETSQVQTPLPELPRTSGELITQLSQGSNLVDGVPTWQLAESAKNNLEVMLKCCEAEIRTMADARVVAAPFFFERAAFLLRKQKRYEEEISVCRRYVEAVAAHYSSNSDAREADVRLGPRYKAIEARIEKAITILHREQ